MNDTPARLSILAGIVLLLGACAHVPTPLRGDYGDLLPAQAGSEAHIGAQVRWGGEIIATRTLPDRTCFELLGKPLRDTTRPTRVDESAGRFIACRSGFYDPVLFAEGRDLTVTGRIDAIERQRIGEYEYAYPRIAADVVYLWPDHLDDRRRASMWIGYRHGPWSVWGPGPFWWP